MKFRQLTSVAITCDLRLLAGRNESHYISLERSKCDIYIASKFKIRALILQQRDTTNFFNELIRQEME